MKSTLSLFLLFALVLSLVGCTTGGTPLPTEETQKYTDYSFDYFDTVTTIIGYATDEVTFQKTCVKIKGLLRTYHRLFDIYNTYPSVANLATINSLVDGVHPTVQVDEELLVFLEFCKEMFTKTSGYVNIAMGSVLSIWHDYREAGLLNPLTATLPPMEALENAKQHTDIDSLIIDRASGTVHITDPLTTLDVGAIAKGYAVEQIARVLEEEGYRGFVLNVGGNVRTIGTPSSDKKWTVAVENPGSDQSARPYLCTMKVDTASLVTSGVTQRFYTVAGKQYHHIIDPDTLMPATHYLSVSVLTRDSGIADALSTALFTRPYADCLTMLEQFPEVEVLWVTTAGEILYTDGFADYDTDFT